MATTPTMTEADVRATVLRVLSEVAPEADVSALEPDIDFRDQLDIDSMDYLNFVIALHSEFGIEIPELDYPKFSSLDGCVTYLRTARGA